MAIETGMGMVYVFSVVIISVILIYYMFRLAAKQREIEHQEMAKYFNP